jgi:hypothetical protein
MAGAQQHMVARGACVLAVTPGTHSALDSHGVYWQVETTTNFMTMFTLLCLCGLRITSKLTDFVIDG